MSEERREASKTPVAPAAALSPTSDPTVPASASVPRELGVLPTATPEELAVSATDAGTRIAPAESLVGSVLDGRYSVLEPLGEGGMGVVYLGRHEHLRKLVAIKVLRRELASSKESLLRFHREAMAAASIGDPHIVDVTDYGFTENGDAFLVMERLEGRDLQHAIVDWGALPAGRAVGIAAQILRALQAAHGRGIIHRDLKAENVFLTERDGQDFIKLLDFGISKITQPLDDNPLGATGTGVVMGTPLYIAPEQAQGERNLDQRVDLYALGVILYQMLTGSLPFTGNNALEVMVKHVNEAPTPPRQRRPDLDISPGLEAITLRALAKRREERYQSAEEMLAALNQAGAMPVQSSSVDLPAMPERSSHWRALAVALVVGLGVIGAGAWLLLRPARTAAPAGADSTVSGRRQRPITAATQPAAAGNQGNFAKTSRDYRVALEPDGTMPLMPNQYSPKAKRLSRPRRGSAGATPELQPSPYRP
jgi:eukaryotic-like serine/threonine-protein kinase